MRGKTGGGTGSTVVPAVAIVTPDRLLYSV